MDVWGKTWQIGCIRFAREKEHVKYVVE